MKWWTPLHIKFERELTSRLSRRIFEHYTFNPRLFDQLVSCGTITEEEAKKLKEGKLADSQRLRKILDFIELGV